MQRERSVSVRVECNVLISNANVFSVVCSQLWCLMRAAHGHIEFTSTPNALAFNSNSTWLSSVGNQQQQQRWRRRQRSHWRTNVRQTDTITYYYVRRKKEEDCVHCSSIAVLCNFNHSPASAGNGQVERESHGAQACVKLNHQKCVHK